MLHMSADVRRALGPFGVAEAERAAKDTACVVCTRHIDPAAGANTQVIRDPQENLNVVFTHPDCGPSQLLDGNEALIADPEGEDMTMTALPAATGPRMPVLAAQLVHPVYTRPDNHTELTEALAPYLLSRGFSVVGELDSEPARADQWVAAVLPHDDLGPTMTRLLILDPDANQFFAGVIHTPDGWQRQALAEAKVVLYVGDAGLDPTSDEIGVQHRRLDHAARQGRLLAATIGVIDPQA